MWLVIEFIKNCTFEKLIILDIGIGCPNYVYVLRKDIENFITLKTIFCKELKFKGRTKFAEYCLV